MTAVFAIVKRLLASNKLSFLLTALVMLCAASSGNVVLSNGNYAWLLAVMAPFFFVFYAFKKLLYLGASKKHYFFACLLAYGALALGISFVNTLFHYLLDPLYPAQTVINLMDVCRWTQNGAIVAGLQQACFFAAGHGVFACAAFHAGALVRLAGRRGAGCHHQHFHAGGAAAGCAGRVFPGDYAERQRRRAHWRVPGAVRRAVAWRACRFKKKNTVTQ